MTMKKISFAEVDKKFSEYNEAHQNGEDGTCIKAVVVFKESNWNKPYSETQRSYVIRSNCRRWQSGKIANSWTGDCLDGTDIGVRLDWYAWEIDYCYMLEE